MLPTRPRAPPTLHKCHTPCGLDTASTLNTPCVRQRKRRQRSAARDLAQPYADLSAPEPETHLESSEVSPESDGEAVDEPREPSDRGGEAAAQRHQEVPDRPSDRIWAGEQR
eukprot:2951222-Pyramimonas_sp.AAC.1